jgi:hypothetical protein
MSKLLEADDINNGDYIAVYSCRESVDIQNPAMLQTLLPVRLGVPLCVLNVSLPFIACAMPGPNNEIGGPVIIDIRDVLLCRVDNSFIEAITSFPCQVIDSRSEEGRVLESKELNTSGQPIRQRPGSGITKYGLSLTADQEHEVEAALKMRLVILDSFFDDPGYQERQEGFGDGEEKEVLRDLDLTKEAIVALALSSEIENRLRTMVTLDQLDETFKAIQSHYEVIKDMDPNSCWDKEVAKSVYLEISNVLLEAYMSAGLHQQKKFEIAILEHEISSLGNGSQGKSTDNPA